MTEPVLDARGLCKRFGGLTASRDIDLDLRPGEIHALIGPNGAGKSTLIKQIAGALRPDAGHVRFAGRDVTRLSTAARARMGLARTFQISSLAMDYTALQNTLLGALGRRGDVFRVFDRVMADRALIAAADTALERVGLADMRAVRTSELSHGQRRQLEVAVALTLEPRALLMDEPTAGLGAEGTRQLVALLDTLRHAAPILLVEHDMDAVFSLADRVSVLVYGEIIATGPVEEIRANREVRRAYLGDEDVA
jgi:branched-chain amino acid transport system ATP-binding protein